MLERLATDFAGGRIFRTDPIVPPAFKIDWEFDVYVRGDAEDQEPWRALPHQHPAALRPGQGVPGAQPGGQPARPTPPATLQPAESFIDRVARRGNCVVLNDEAHHTNDKAVAWTM